MKTRNVMGLVTIQLALGHWLPIRDPLKQSLYLSPFSR